MHSRYWVWTLLAEMQEMPHSAVTILIAVKWISVSDSEFLKHHYGLGNIKLVLKDTDVMLSCNGVARTGCRNPGLFMEITRFYPCTGLIKTFNITSDLL
jgi:hypothetical protein